MYPLPEIVGALKHVAKIVHPPAEAANKDEIRRLQSVLD